MMKLSETQVRVLVAFLSRDVDAQIVLEEDELGPSLTVQTGDEELTLDLDGSGIRGYKEGPWYLFKQTSGGVKVEGVAPDWLLPVIQ